MSGSFHINGHGLGLSKANAGLAQFDTGAVLVFFFEVVVSAIVGWELLGKVELLL
jgi:hypothetical protein